MTTAVLERPKCECKVAPLHESPIPKDVPGAWYDFEKVENVKRVCREFRHTKGRFAGKHFDLDLWQIEHIVAPAFGWRYSLDPAECEDPEQAGTRIVRTVYIEVPRKNGKSTLAAALALVLLVADGEWGGEVYAAALTRPQAGRVFDEAKRMAQGVKSLKGKLKYVGEEIRVPRTGSIFEVLSREADFAHGLNVSGAVVDELHLHKNRKLVEALESGTGFREQPLIIFITTADEGDDYTIYAEKHDYALSVSNGAIYDPSFLCAIWAAEPDDDPFAESTWRKANPGLGTTVRLSYLRGEAKKAKANPITLASFKRLHLGIRTRSAARWFTPIIWDNGNDPYEKLEGREVWAGIDLSAVNDLTALAMIAPFETTEGRVGLDLVVRHWIPDEDLKARGDRDGVPYERWVEEGLIETTEGNIVDYDIAEKAILALEKEADLQRLSYDRWFAGPLVQRVQHSRIPVASVAQTFLGLSQATKELEMLMRAGRIRHGANELLRWQALNADILSDNHSNQKPIKPDRKKSVKRVDGMTASVMALDGYIRREIRREYSSASY